VPFNSWSEDEFKPTSILLAFASVAGTNLTVTWNGQAVRSIKLGNHWWQAELAGKSLAEACWCESGTQTDKECRRLLFKKAQQSTLKYLQPNNCRLSVYGDHMIVSEYMVGHSWKADSVFGAQALEVAFEDGTDKAKVNLAQRQSWLARKTRQIRQREFAYLGLQES